MGLYFDGTDDYESYVQDGLPGFSFTIPVTIFLRYRFDSSISASGETQPIFTVAEPTIVSMSGSSFQVGKSGSNQMIAKCQRVGDPVGWTGLHVATTTAVTANSWHAVVCQFDDASIKIWVDGNAPSVTSWNKNNGVVNLQRAGLGGVYLYGDGATNVKPLTGSLNAYYGAGELADVGVMNSTYDQTQLDSYLTGTFSCPKMYESYGGQWKYMMLSTLPAGVSSGAIPGSARGQAASYSNYAVVDGVQSNGPKFILGWPTLILPSAATIQNILGCRQIITNVSMGRRIGV